MPIDGRIRSVAFAVAGIRTLLRTQHNARIHAVATVVVFVAGVLFGVSRLEWCLLVTAVTSVWTAEALNTSVEMLADVTSPEFHPMIGQAKDVAAGAVLIAAVGSAAVGVFVFGPHCLQVLGVDS